MCFGVRATGGLGPSTGRRDGGRCRRGATRGEQAKGTAGLEQPGPSESGGEPAEDCGAPSEERVARPAGRRREEVLTLCAVAAAQEEAKIHALFEAKDADKSGGLDEAQMKDFMQEYVRTTPGNEEKTVSDAEVKCVPPTAPRPVRYRAREG